MIPTNNKPSDQQAEEAVRTLIRWIGDDPNRKELIRTPKRVLEFYRKLFRGYNLSYESVADNTTFSNEDYKDMVVLKNIDFLSYCEHHIVPIKGTINIGYVPNKTLAGINKIIELIDIFTKRLQIQERLSCEIANALNQFLKPKGVAVLVCASHDCVACYDEQDKNNLTMNTSHMTGVFAHDINTRQEFFLHVKS